MANFNKKAPRKKYPYAEHILLNFNSAEITFSRYGQYGGIGVTVFMRNIHRAKRIVNIYRHAPALGDPDLNSTHSAIDVQDSAARVFVGVFKKAKAKNKQLGEFSRVLILMGADFFCIWK